jgi:hypothetical protein
LFLRVTNIFCLHRYIQSNSGTHGVCWAPFTKTKPTGVCVQTDLYPVSIISKHEAALLLHHNLVLMVSWHSDEIGLISLPYPPTNIMVVPLQILFPCAVDTVPLGQTVLRVLWNSKVSIIPPPRPPHSCYITLTTESVVEYAVK